MNRKILTEQRGIQGGILEMDFKALPAESLLKNGALFHRELIRLSGNPYFLMALQRVNRMRRLMEYRAEVNHKRHMEQCREHLEIPVLLEAGNTVDASYRMRQHLSGALKRKSSIAWNWAVGKATVEALKKGA